MLVDIVSRNGNLMVRARQRFVSWTVAMAGPSAPSACSRRRRHDRSPSTELPVAPRRPASKTVSEAEAPSDQTGVVLVVELEQAVEDGAAWLSIPPLQVRQIAALHRCALGELLLRPIPRAPERFDPPSKEFQDLGLGYRELLMVSGFVIECCTIRVTIPSR